MSEERKGKWKAVKVYRLTNKGKAMIRERELIKKEKAEIEKLMERLRKIFDPMASFKNFSQEYINEVCKKYKENYNKWALCPQKHCVFNSAYTSHDTFDKRCENCDQNDPYRQYASE